LTQPHAAIRTAPTLSQEETENVRIYKTTNQAVVNIASQTASEDVYLNIVPKEGYGSGIIISPDGYILTNNHVINGASAVRVSLYDGTNYSAQLVGDDPTNDLAVLKITVPQIKS